MNLTRTRAAHTPTATPPTALALPRLTSLRAFAAAAVFVFHLGTLHVVRRTPIGEMGNVGVCFFFVLSGFVLTWSLKPGVTARAFYRNRFARIYPSHLVVTIIALFVITDFPKSWGSFLTSMTLVQSWSTDDSIVWGMNGVSWTLACEAAFYAAFPLTLLLLTRVSAKTRWAVAVVWWVAALVLSLASEHLPTSLPILPALNPVVRFSEFLVGVVAALTIAGGWRPRITMWQASLAVACSVAICRYVPFAADAPHQLMVPAFLALILAAVCADLNRRSGVLTWRWLVRAGEVSFAFYLVHHLVMLNVRSWLGFNGVSMAVIVLLASIACALVLHRTVERPFQARLRAQAKPRPRLAPHHTTGDRAATRTVQQLEPAP